MQRGKVKLICYKKENLPRANFVYLPYFFKKGLYVYSGNKFEKLVMSSMLMCFFKVRDFILTKKIGPIHPKKDKNKKNQKKKK